jgi:hypothetical protein
MSDVDDRGARAAERRQQGLDPLDRGGIVAGQTCCLDLVEAALDIDHEESRSAWIESVWHAGTAPSYRRHLASMRLRNKIADRS